MQLEIEDRENMFAIVDKIMQDSGLDEQSTTRLGVSTRLLGPLMMQDRIPLCLLISYFTLETSCKILRRH